jgi:hypothetical protein
MRTAGGLEKIEAADLFLAPASDDPARRAENSTESLSR